MVLNKSRQDWKPKTNTRFPETFQGTLQVHLETQTDKSESTTSPMAKWLEISKVPPRQTGSGYLYVGGVNPRDKQTPGVDGKSVSVRLFAKGAVILRK